MHQSGFTLTYYFFISLFPHLQSKNNNPWLKLSSHEFLEEKQSRKLQENSDRSANVSTSKSLINRLLSRLLDNFKSYINSFKPL